MKTLYFTLTVTWKEFQIFLKDRGWLVILFLLPLMISSFSAVPNMLANQDPGKTILVNAGLVNLDGGDYGREVAKAVQAITQLSITPFTSEVEAEAPVIAGKSAAAIIIPADFSLRINDYQPTQIKVVVDPAEPETASIVTGIMNQVVGEVAIWGEVQHGVRAIFEESGLLAKFGAAEKRALEAQNLGVIMTRINEERRNPVITVLSEDLSGVKVEGGIGHYFAYMFPALTVMFIFFIVPMAADSLLKERETGTFRRILSSPIPRGAVVGGKILAYMVLAFLQVVVMMTVAVVGFKTPIGHSPLSLVVVTLLTAFVACSLGLLVATFSKTSSQAGSISLILAFILAGIGGALPTTASSFYRAGGFMGIVSQITPHAHAIEAFFKVMAENGTFLDILPQVGILSAFGVAFFGIAIWRFRFE